jgi:protein tyrosine/serine phosphatase
MIINCTFELPFINYLAENKVRISLSDPPQSQYDVDMFINYVTSDLFLKIDQNVSQKPILIHCHKGKQRSAAVVAAYLMWKYRMSIVEACTFIRQKRPCVFRNIYDDRNSDPDLLSINYYKILEQFNNILLLHRSVI